MVNPYGNSNLKFRIKDGISFPADSVLSLSILEWNGLAAYCGSPSSSLYFDSDVSSRLQSLIVVPSITYEELGPSETHAPSFLPSFVPTTVPSTLSPSMAPSFNSSNSSMPTSQPSGCPSGEPSRQPSSAPSNFPSLAPTGQPSLRPSGQPTVPTSQPSASPSMPTGIPTGEPSTLPTSQPSMFLPVTFNQFPGIGTGCSHLKNCSGHGTCDYCYGKCICDEGYGAATDLIVRGRDVSNSCSKRKFHVLYVY